MKLNVLGRIESEEGRRFGGELRIDFDIPRRNIKDSVIHLVCRQILDDGVNALSVNCHGEDLVAGLILKSHALGHALETVGHARQRARFDDLVIGMEKSSE